MNQVAESDGSAEQTAAPRRSGQDIYDRLKRDILTFQYRPGERLVELELCDLYKVSRTPVREALRRLEDDGLVVSRARGGRVVRGLDISDYEDAYAVRAALETFAVRDLAARAGELDMDTLEAHWQRGYPPDSTPLDGSYVEADERFHMGLALATGNAYLVELIERIHDRLHTIRSFDFTVRERLINSAAQHRAILAAIRVGDSDLAAKLMESHIAQSKDEIRGILVRILSHAYVDGEPR